MMKKSYDVIVPTALKPKPSEREMSAADILAEYFKTTVRFIERENYKTPDFLIDGKRWELKTPTGEGKRNIQHAISGAIKQSPYIVIDARFSKVHITKIKSRLNAEIKVNRQIKKLLLIDKQKKVVEISR